MNASEARKRTEAAKEKAAQALAEQRKAESERNERIRRKWDERVASWVEMNWVPEIAKAADKGDGNCIVKCYRSDDDDYPSREQLCVATHALGYKITWQGYEPPERDSDGYKDGDYDWFLVTWEGR
jgi:hypothetical protein